MEGMLNCGCRGNHPEASRRVGALFRASWEAGLCQNPEEEAVGLEGEHLRSLIIASVHKSLVDM